MTASSARVISRPANSRTERRWRSASVRGMAISASSAGSATRCAQAYVLPARRTNSWPSRLLLSTLTRLVKARSLGRCLAASWCSSKTNGSSPHWTADSDAIWNSSSLIAARSRVGVWPRVRLRAAAREPDLLGHGVPSGAAEQAVAVIALELFQSRAVHLHDAEAQVFDIRGGQVDDDRVAARGGDPGRQRLYQCPGRGRAGRDPGEPHLAARGGQERHRLAHVGAGIQLHPGSERGDVIEAGGCRPG